MAYPFTVYEIIGSTDETNLIKSNVKKEGENLVLSPFVCEPKLEYGFHYFIHQTKNKTSIKSQERYRNKWQVTNSFEHTVTDYDKDIQKMSELYFSLPVNGIISRAFYKLWEVLIAFDIIPEIGSIKTAHIAEAPGGFIQAVGLYRDKFFKASDVAKDNYSTISIISKDTKNVPIFKTTVLKNMKQLSICKAGNCDIMNIDVQNQYVKDTGLVDLVTADGGFVWQDENYQEQEAFKLLMAEIILAMKLQKQSGCFVLKIFDIFTDVMVKILALLRAYYKQVYVFIPLMSRPSNSEKYVICQGFQGITPKEINNLEKILVKMPENPINADTQIKDKNFKRSNFTIDIFPDYNLSPNIKIINKTMGVYIANEQFKNINKTIAYLEKGIFFGDDYHRFREEQIKASEYWISSFYPINQSDFKVIKKKMKKILEDSLLESTKKVDELKHRLKHF